MVKMAHPDQLFHAAGQSHIIMTDDGWRHPKRPLPEGAARAHLNGGPRYGVPFVRRNENTVMAGMIDLDDHAGGVGWERVVAVAALIMGKASDAGVVLHPFRSGGGHGINLWAVWDEPQPATAVKRTLTDIVLASGYKVGAGGVVKAEVEVFPKQGALGEGEYGNCAALPRSPLDPWTLDDCDECVWEMSVALPDDTESEGAGIKATPSGNGVSDGDQVSIETLRDAVGRMAPEDDYDQWIKLVAAIHHCSGGSEAGKEIAGRWSAKSSSYKKGDISKRWSGFDSDGSALAGWGTIAARVEQDTGKSVADLAAFPVASVGDGEVIPDYKRVPGKGRHSGKKESSVSQLLTLLRSDPEFPWRLTIDEFLQERLIITKSTGATDILGDEHYVKIQGWCDDHHWEPVAFSVMRSVCNAAALDAKSDMALDWADTLKWDGVDRYGMLITAMGAEPSEYYRAVVEYQWTSHAARLVHPGYQADAIVVYVSEKQGTGKTQMINAFAPKFRDYSTYQDVHIDMLLAEDKSARAMRGALVVNLDEMRYFTKREAAEVKSALSRMVESYIPKYIEKKSVFGRRGVIYATNNEVEFLNDQSGNRRYHAILVGEIDLGWVKENVEQLWAQGLSQFKSTGQAWKTALQLAPEIIKIHDISDSWDDAIEEYLDNSLTDSVTITDVLRQAIGMPIERHDRATQLRVGKILRGLGWEKVRMRVGDKISKVFQKKGQQGATRGNIVD